MKYNMYLRLIILITLGLVQFDLIDSCSSFYCVNSCGESSTHRGFKLILVNNRDEDIYRSTLNADLWPTSSNQQTNLKFTNKCLNEPCVYGPLDVKNGQPPNYYSTWLGINTKGDIGNLLFFLVKGAPSGNKLKNRGVVVSNYLLNLTINSEDYLEVLTNEKSLYGPFNYVQLSQSKTGEYFLYYLNNNDTNKYIKLNNQNDKEFIFGLSNSDPNREFQKVTNGKLKFSNIVENFRLNSDKKQLVDSLIDLLQDKTENMPDENLATFMQTNNQDLIKGVSRVNANYTTFWTNASTRTSTLILVDYDNNVDYYEYNMTSINEWKMNKFSFKLSSNQTNQIKSNFLTILIISIAFMFVFFF